REGLRLIAHELTHVVQNQDRAPQQLIRRASGASMCDPNNLGLLGPAFVKSEDEVKKLKLPERLLKSAVDPGERGFAFYCPQQASIALGSLVPNSVVYLVGTGKVKGKDEVWAKIEGHDKYYWGFIKSDKYSMPVAPLSLRDMVTGSEADQL